MTLAKIEERAGARLETLWVSLSDMETQNTTYGELDRPVGMPMTMVGVVSYVIWIYRHVSVEL